MLYQKLIKLFQMVWILVTCWNVKITKSSRIFGSFKISYNSKVFIGKNSHVDSLEVMGWGELIIKDNVNIKNLFVNFGEQFSKIVIEENVFVGNGCKFIIFGELTICKGTLIAPEVMIVDTKHIFGREKKLVTSGITIGNIYISENVWIGSKSIILPNVCIATNTVIAAGSIVNKCCDSDSIYGGNPAKRIKDIE